MDKIPKLIPIWLWVAIVIIIVALCSSCRGGRSLGKGSVGTVIVPQTPQEINERRSLPPPDIVLPPLEPLAPIPITPPARTHTNAVKSNPVIINPKSAGEARSFSPTISPTPVKLPPAKAEKLSPKLTDDKATAEANDFPLCDPMETAETESFNWVELLLNYLLFIIIAIFIWAVYDIIRRRGNSTENRLSSRKLKKGCGKKDSRATKKTVKKKTTPKSKKKLEEYKKTIPKGIFFREDF